MVNEVAIVAWEVVAFGEGHVVARNIGTKAPIYDSGRLPSAAVQDRIDKVVKEEFLDKGWELVAVQPVLIGETFEDTHYTKYYMQHTVV